MATVQTQSLADKVALVTGGSKGIGARIVRRLDRTARLLRSPIRVQEKWPSNLQMKFNLREAGRCL
jgi:NAD(P)-dependent dehydrogenase (short-subunit alcohol dehydrogenase family)